MRRFWIAHPAMHEPVSLWRWLQFQVAQWLISLGYKGRRLEYRALYGEDDDIPF